MDVVVDSNVLVALTTDGQRGPTAKARIRQWREQGDVLHAPTLLRYEMASALTQLVAAGTISVKTAQQAWNEAVKVAVRLHELHDAGSVLSITAKLKRRSAYDAAYVALAQELDTSVWTFDGPLYRNAAQSGLPVQLIEVVPNTAKSPPAG